MMASILPPPGTLVGGPGALPPIPSPTERIHLVMRECECDESRAAQLLALSGNDVNKAISRHRKLQTFLSRHGHSGAIPAPAIPPPTPHYRGRSVSGRQTPGAHSRATSVASWGMPTPDTDTSSSDPNKFTLSPPQGPLSPNPPLTPPGHGIRYPDIQGPHLETPIARRPLVAERSPPTPDASHRRRFDGITLPATPEPISLPSVGALPIVRAMDSTGGSTFNTGNPEPPPPEDVPMADSSPVVADTGLHEQPESSLNPFPEGVVEAPAPQPEWDFTLPRLSFPENLYNIPSAGGEDGQLHADLDITELAAAVQNGINLQRIQMHLGSCSSAVVRSQINTLVQGFPSIFYAVESNDPAMLRLWAAHGADISATHPQTGTPLLAYAIILGDVLDGCDTSTMVATLLSLGASPKVVPEPFYQPYTRDLPSDGPRMDEEDGAERNEEWEWCTPVARKRLAQAANLTQRYYLDRATRLKRAGIRHRQIAMRRNAEAILGIQYFLIGQTLASNRLLRKLLSYITLPSKRPLILAFAGPSGHGKTELARRLGYLLGLELQVVDCTTVSQEKELFGPRAPYVGSERGSPLNNFIARNAGRRSVVFIDEFEKTSRDIHQTLLLPFDNGEYQDRRHLTTVDCSKTIWILATNALDDTIIKFCGLNPDIFSDDTTKSEPLSKQLSKDLRKAFLDHFGAPVTGRISDFIPFLPFSPSEQAVVAHKFVLELAEKVRAPVNLSPGPEERLLGNVRLRVRRDAQVCAHLAASEYSEELGARSLRTAVEQVEDVLVERYLDGDQEIGEDTGLKDFVVDVKGGEIVISRTGPEN